MSGVDRGDLPGDHFTIISNAWLRDESLSWKAKGLLAYLASHAQGFRVSQNLMLRQATDGRDSLLSGLAELERAGYLVRGAPDRDDTGRYGSYDYRLTDPGRPTESAPNRSGGPTSSGNPHRVTRSGSPENKKNNQEEQGTPTESRTEETGQQLRLVEDTPADRRHALGSLAAAVAREYVDSCSGMANYLAVLGIVKRALDVRADGQNGSAAGSGTLPRYGDEQIRKALADLRNAGRPVTLQTMHAALESPRTVAGNGYRAGPNRTYGPLMDIPPDPNEHRGAF